MSNSTQFTMVQVMKISLDEAWDFFSSPATCENYPGLYEI